MILKGSVEKRNRRDICTSRREGKRMGETLEHL